MGTYNKANGTYEDSLTGKVSAPKPGTQFKLEVFDTRSNRVTDKHYVDEFLTVMDIYDVSMKHEHKIHNAKKLAEYFSNPEIEYYKLPKRNGFEFRIFRILPDVPPFLGVSDEI